MANTITGKLYKIGAVETIPSKDGSKSFTKREIVIDATRFDPYTGQRGMENMPMLEFSGDKCAELDSFRVGEVVTVSFDLTGVRYNDKDNNERFFTRIRAYRIERRQQVNASAPQPMAAQPPMQPAQQAYQPTTPPMFDVPKDNGGLPF